MTQLRNNAFTETQNTVLGMQSERKGSALDNCHKLNKAEAWITKQISGFGAWREGSVTVLSHWDGGHVAI